MAAAAKASALVDGDVGTYDTAEAAAIAALRSIKEQNSETGGGVLFNAATGKYAFTQPVGEKDGYHFQARVQVPQGWKLHAIYHTHPKGANSTYFSADDVSAANQLKIPSYILPRADDKIRRLQPGAQLQGDALRPSSDTIQQYALGEVVNEPAPALYASAAPAATPTVAPAAGLAPPTAAPASSPVVTGARIGGVLSQAATIAGNQK